MSRSGFIPTSGLVASGGGFDCLTSVRVCCEFYLLSCSLLISVMFVVKPSLKQVRVKKFVPNKKGEVYYLCHPNIYVIMSLLVNLVSSSDGNDIVVGLT